MLEQFSHAGSGDSHTPAIINGGADVFHSQLSASVREVGCWSAGDSLTGKLKGGGITE
jgi:hypothetical protein